MKLNRSVLMNFDRRELDLIYSLLVANAEEGSYYGNKVHYAKRLAKLTERVFTALRIVGN